jgi:hypothetical protein
LNIWLLLVVEEEVLVLVLVVEVLVDTEQEIF